MDKFSIFFRYILCLWIVFLINFIAQVAQNSDLLLSGPESVALKDTNLIGGSKNIQVISAYYHDAYFHIDKNRVEALPSLQFEKVSPNPAKQYTRVYFSNLPQYQPFLKAQVYDYIGTLILDNAGTDIVYDRSTGLGKMTIDLNSLRSGYFIIKISNGDYAMSKGIIVIK